jgi:hypothetical protein
MFCPRCGANQSEELKFCKSCGANLYAVRQVVDTRKTDKKTGRGRQGHFSDRNKPWFAPIAISAAESKRRKEELDHKRGIVPEVKRYNEIKGGVITGSIGLALAIFLSVFMQGLILSGKVAPDVAEILSRLWVVGVIPFFVGLALIVNGVFVGKKLAKIARQAALNEMKSLEQDENAHSLHPADTTQFVPSGVSVTEGTTKHLRSSDPKI